MDRVLGVIGNLGGAGIMVFLGSRLADVFFRAIGNLQSNTSGSTLENLGLVVVTGILALCVATMIIVAVARAIFAAVGLTR